MLSVELCFRRSRASARCLGVAERSELPACLRVSFQSEWYIIGDVNWIELAAFTCNSGDAKEPSPWQDDSSCYESDEC